MRIVKYKGDNQLYAVKYIDKEACIKKKSIKNTILERNILGVSEHAFITNLRFAFQDEDNMFMVLDLMLGGDMKFMMKTRGLAVPESWL